MKPIAVINKRARAPWTAVIAVIFMSAVLPGSAFAGWDDYQPATLSATIVKYEPSCNDPDLPMTYCVVGFQRMRVQAVFLGNIRDIGAQRGTYLMMWRKSLGIDPAFINRFEKEIQVREGDQTYWLPIQTVLIDPLKKEVAKKGRVLLYVGFIGAAHQDWVFLVNEFEAQ